jgi:predicted DsbA family dithiol-disulfide isomerase
MNEPGILSLFYDYVDPASFVLENRLRKLESRGLFSLALEPFERSIPPAPLLDPEEAGMAGHWEAMIHDGGKLGLELARPWIVPWSRKAHELALQAKKEGCFQEIHEALFQAYLVEGLDIGRIDVLVDLGRRFGMDPTDTRAVLDVDLHTASVLEKRQRALRVGVAGPPTLRWQEESLVGYPDEKTLEEFLSLRDRRET